MDDSAKYDHPMLIIQSWRLFWARGPGMGTCSIRSDFDPSFISFILKRDHRVHAFDITIMERSADSFMGDIQITSIDG